MVSSSSTTVKALSFTIMCYAVTSPNNNNTADAFSLVQNAAASSKRERDDANGGGGSGGRSGSSAGRVATGVSTSRRAAAASSSVASNNSNAHNPFRGSLSTDQRRRRSLGNRFKQQLQQKSGDHYQYHQQQQQGDDFALRMGMHDELEYDATDDVVDGNDPHDSSDMCSTDCNSATSTTSSSGEQQQSESSADQHHSNTNVHERRKFLHTLVTSTAAFATASTATTTTSSSSFTTSPLSPEPANAYETTFPIELTSTTANSNEETSSNSISKLQEERLSIQRSKIAQTQSELSSDPLGLGINPLSANGALTIGGASLWALALWFISGSRSNALVTPLANVLYDESKEEWLQDRNEGYFGEVPLSLMVILSTVFLMVGIVADRAVYFLADGDAEVSLQLAGVTAISGLFWELGRVASGEKDPTRQESDRDELISTEFDEFASKRIVVKRGSCHRSDVISAFRRFNAKYRTADNEEYPLADIEIERILRKWNREKGSGSEMSSAGFFVGIVVEDPLNPR